MLTKKHFIAAAEYIRNAPHSKKERLAMYDAMVVLFKSENPKFDVGRFRNATGLVGPATIQARHDTKPRLIRDAQ